MITTSSPCTRLCDYNPDVLMNVVEQLRTLHEINFLGAGHPFSEENVRRFLDEYGYERVEDVPAWFTRMVRMVVDREPGSYLFDQVGSEMSSLLEELRRTYGWSVDDYGEGIELAFPASKMRVFISREARSPAGTACSSCSVTAIS